MDKVDTCVPLSYLTFFVISDVMFCYVICYEACKFPFDTLVSCVILSYISFMIHIPLESAMKLVSIHLQTHWFRVSYYYLSLI